MVFWRSATSPQGGWSSPGEPGNHRRPALLSQTAGSRPGPRPSPGRRDRVRMPRPDGDTALTPPAMAKPTGGDSPSAAPGAARGRRNCRDRCLGPPGRGFDANPPGDGRAAGIAYRKPACCGRGVSLSIFLVATRKDGHARGRTRPITAQPKAPQETGAAGQATGPPACRAGRANRVPGCPCPRQGARNARRRQWRKPDRQQPFPFCRGAGRSTRGQQGIVASMSLPSPPGGEFRLARPARTQVGLKERTTTPDRRCGRAASLPLLCRAARREVARRADQPITAGRKPTPPEQ